MDMVTAHPMELGLILGLVTLLILWIYTYSLRISTKPGVPRGRFWQIPHVGETLALASLPFEDFLWPRIQRYGRNFRTHLFGDPCICVSTYDQIRFVLQSPQIFKRRLLKNHKDLLSGDLEEDFIQGKGAHILKVFSRTTIKKNVAELDKRCKIMLVDWGSMKTVNLEKVEKFALTGAAILICDDLISAQDTPDGQRKVDKIINLLVGLRDGLRSFPVNIPGTVYYRSVRMQKELVKELMPFVTRRRAEKGLLPHHDLLEFVVRAGEESFTDSEAVNVLISLLFAGLETSAIALIWNVLELVRRPELVALLRGENDRLAEEVRRRADAKLTLEDVFEKLPLTYQFLNETLRLHNIAPFTIRDIAEDVVHEGIFYPKGWRVLITWVPIHKDHDVHSNPDTFDPSNFASESASKQENFMPFSFGQYYCKGQDAFKVEAMVFLHNLLSGYDCKVAEEGGRLYSGITQYPAPRPNNIAPMTFSKRRSEHISSP